MWIIVIALAAAAALLWIIGQRIPRGEQLMDAAIAAITIAVALLGWIVRGA